MKIKKKYTSGTAQTFISRKRALKKLQLSLRDFGKLCILKGIYPREPNHLKKANKGGSSEPKIFYHIRDIKFLAQEPLINKFRELRIFLKKVRHARAKKEELKVRNLFRQKPTFTYDHILKERYPTFASALRDLDDALCLCFAFSVLTQSKVAHSRVINRCKRLTVEFLHYIIEARALRKAFISIKGIYYQAEVMGEKITWIVGHERSVGRANELDLTTLANFTEFYTCMLAFVNFRLFKEIGLFYPPQLQLPKKEENDYYSTPTPQLDDRVCSLAFPLEKVEKSEELDIFPLDAFPADGGEENETQGGDDFAERIRQTEALKMLFAKLKFFLNREVSKEPLAFLIRAGGGFVCWEEVCPVGSVGGESSELITHQIVDREMQEMNMSRVYIQPQWVFDCFNARRLLPTMCYAPGSMLPPHLSPFVAEQSSNGDNRQSLFVVDEEQPREEETKKTENGEVKPETDAQKMPAKNANKKKKHQNKQQEMTVQKSKVHRESAQKKINEEGHNLKLREMMMAKKHKRVYEKVKRNTKRREKAEAALEHKRKRARLESVRCEKGA